MHHHAGKLGPIREGLEPARRGLVAELRRVFMLLSVSLRQYAATQEMSPSLISRYLKGEVMPPETFLADLADEAKLNPAEVDRLAEMYRAAQDAQPRGWGNVTRLRRDIAEALRRARSAEHGLALLTEQSAAAQQRIAELEQECEILRGRPRRVPVDAPRHYWDLFRRLMKFPAERIATLDRATDQILAGLPDPASNDPGRSRVRVFIPVGSGKTTYLTAVTAKAVDAGYRLIIVLSPPLNAVRSQLQSRLADVLAGPGVLLLTGPDADYRSLHPVFWGPESFARLLVVKRNVPVLRKIIRDLQAIRTPLHEIPALVIDADGSQLLPGGALDRLVEQLLEILPRAQLVRFDDVVAVEPERGRETLVSISR